MLAFLIHHEAFVQSILQLLSYLYCQVTSICRFTSMKHILLFAALTSSVISAETQHQVKRSFPTYSEYSLRYAQRARANTGLAPGATCSSDANCAGYPLAYCDGVCRCTNEALNAGSTCIKAASQPLEACPSGQTYISEAGACMTGQYPGEPCQYSQQCAAMEPGAFCLQLRCECMYGMIRNGNGCTFVNDECRERGSIFIPELGECRQVLAPGTQSCSHNLQCAQAFPGATCFQQTCTCPSSFPEEVDGSCGKRCDLGNTYSSAAGQCLPTVQAGDRCAYSSQCHAVQPGTICERNVCRCPNGMVSSGSKCVQSCPTGQMVNSKGVCAPGCQRNQIEVNGECLYQSAPGQSCRVNAQCTGGSSCLNDVCTCPRGMLPMGGTCDVARSPPMSSCRNGERCSRDAICVDGSCVCPPGRQIVNGQCVVAITVNIGGGCVRLGAVCLGGSVCVAGICVCPLGTTPYLNRCVEHRLAKPGESCSRHEECSSGTHCNPVVGSQCVERLRSHPGLPCSNMEICVGGSSCIQGVCSCPPGTAETNKECVVIRRARPSEDCTRGEECDGGSICDRARGKCICIDGQRMINDRCVDFVVPLGGFCVPSDRCSGGSYCVDGRCLCVGETYTNGDQCVPRRKILPGSTCQTNDVCTGGSECRENRCTCSNGTVLKGTACVISRKVSIGEKCTPVDECQGNSSCYMQTCECDAGMVVRENVCQRRQTINPGYLCGADDLCIGNSICIRGVCQCRPGSHIQQSQCVKIESDAVMIGGECTHNQQCMGGSTCTGGVCSCPAGMVVSSQQCKKIMKVPPGSSCAAGEVCDGGSVCDNLLQRCRCSSGLKQSGTHCVPIDRDVSLVSAKEDRSFSPASREPFRAQERLLGPSTSSHSLVQTTAAVVAISMVTNPPLSPVSSNMVKNPIDVVSSSKLDLTRPEAFSQAQVSTTAKPLPWFKTRRCSASNQCPSGSSCVGGECRCSQGLALSRLGLCVPITYVLPGMACSEGELCRGDAQCRFGVCVCPAGQQLSGNECLAATREKRRISLMTDKDLEFLNWMGAMEQDLLSSKLAPIVLPDSTASLGERCSTQKPCSTIGSSCIVEICACGADFVQSGNICIPMDSESEIIVKPGLRCSPGAICGAGSSCVGGSCQCSPGFLLIQSICVRNSGRGQLCGDNTVVCNGGSTCSNGVCTCPAGTENINNVCVPSQAANFTRVPPGSKCVDGQDFCTGNSVCANGYCVCPGGEVIRNKICVPVDTEAVIGDMCEEGITKCIGNSQCINGVCRCPLGQNFQPTENRCMVQQMPSTCTMSGCCAGTCPCPGNAPPLPPLCSPTILPSPFFGAPGQQCDFRKGAKLCNGKALCIKNQCVCPTNLILSGNACVEFIGNSFPGQSCASPGTICRGGSTCSNGICKCGFDLSVRNYQCVGAAQRPFPPATPFPIVFTFVPAPLPAITTPSPFIYYLRPGAACDPNCEFRSCPQRCGGGSVCIAGVCTCPIGMFDFQGVCIPLSGEAEPKPTSPAQFARPGDRCDVSIRCTGGSTCVLGTCTCSNGYQPSFDRSSCVLTSVPAVLRSYPEKLCTDSEQCSGRAKCVEGSCVCPDGHIRREGVCVNSSTIPYPGSPCSDFCKNGASCLSKHCVCSSPGHSTNASGHCVPSSSLGSAIALPGAPCNNFVDCQGNSQCLNGFCVCRGTSVNLGSAACEEVKASPMVCKSYKDCVAPRVCGSNQTCECPFTMYEDDGGVCRYIKSNVSPGSPCSRRAKCSVGSSCVDNVCKCDHGSTIAGKPCAARNRQRRDLNEPPQMHSRPSIETCPQNASCQLPDCFCTPTGTAPPGGFSVANVPQMVVLSFDGPVTDRIMKLYKTLFNGKHRNPNGCAIKGTFFVSHQWNNYDQTQWLHGQGHEIAVNSMTSEPLGNHTKQRWTNEIVGMRDALESFSNVERGSIVGVRTPQLSLGGAAQFAMMKEHGFLYDNSMPVREGPLWPQTLDYALAWDCTGQNCPQQPFPGIWSFPLQLLQANDGIWHNTARAALKPFDSRSTVKQFLRRNFYRNYNTNRAPFVLNADTDFLTYLPDNGVLLAVEDWLNEILQRKDVYVVTAKQAIHWIQRPVGINKLSTFKPWRCDRRVYDHLQPCESPSICSYSPTVASHAHSFRVCGTCPRSYPWLGDPLGKRA
ncbi:hypothetical protein Q1695_000364 [Nippostrongylus brasiliensis]|nr:hypothetical protein Q1695_000364 [Nippostrongylus brasiliensis]